MCQRNKGSIRAIFLKWGESHQKLYWAAGNLQSYHLISPSPTYWPFYRNSIKGGHGVHVWKVKPLKRCFKPKLFILTTRRWSLWLKQEFQPCVVNGKKHHSFHFANFCQKSELWRPCSLASDLWLTKRITWLHSQIHLWLDTSAFQARAKWWRWKHKFTNQSIIMSTLLGDWFGVGSFLRNKNCQ